jgi:hypothetical protein
MAAVPQLLKVITLTLDGTDFSMDVLDASVAPEPGDVQSITTLDGVTHQDAAAETWFLNLRMVIDWDTTRPGLAYYLYNNKGDQVAFRFRKDTEAISTTNPEIQGTVTLVATQYGGAGNEFAEAEVSLPITGALVIDTTP